MSSRDIMCIKEEQVGEGLELAFPEMSSCAAVICVLDDETLFGIHKTVGWVRAHEIAFERAKKEIGNREILQIYLVGWYTKDIDKDNDEEKKQHYAQHVTNALVPKKKMIEVFVNDYREEQSLKPGGCTFASYSEGSIKIGYCNMVKEGEIVWESEEKEKKKFDKGEALIRELTIDEDEAVNPIVKFMKRKKKSTPKSIDLVDSDDDNDYDITSNNGYTRTELNNGWYIASNNGYTRTERRHRYGKNAFSNNTRGWKLINEINNDLELKGAKDYGWC